MGKPFRELQRCSAQQRAQETQPPLNLPEGRLAASEEPKKKIDFFFARKFVDRNERFVPLHCQRNKTKFAA